MLPVSAASIVVLMNATYRSISGCGHCKNLAPAWKEAAKALKGIVNIAAVDGTANEDTARKLGVQVNARTRPAVDHRRG
jgi:thiol-disulfide isomerase/thioredoxin